MKTLSVEYASELIEFAPTERARRMGFAEAQLRGAVAAFNMLHRNRIAYLADEVGMGKTYVALAVMNLLRFQDPQARIVVLAPRENIQLKWLKELRNFVRNNWRAADHRVKSLNGEPARTPVACGAIDEILRTLRVSDHVDLLLRSTTFQLSVKQDEGRKRCRRQLLPNVPWISSKLLSDRDPSKFRDMYGRILNALIPPIDLLVVDEAHNFKHGFSEQVSNRNRILGMSLGHPTGHHKDCPWYGRRVKRLLLLSATPFEYDYADLHRQLNVFGFGEARIADGKGNNGIDVRRLLDDDEAVQRELVRRFLIRRVQYLNIGGRPHSKNMYRREWRAGGYERHDEPAELTDPEQQLVVGLIQKKVAEILGDRRFNNNFQIGMLSSFESFMESLSRRKRKPVVSEMTVEGDGEPEPVFDGEQEASRVERQGVDSQGLENIVRSYRERFQRSLPHPKLDATAASLADAFETGEKALVFVRRIATVSELKVKLDEHYDRSLKLHMQAMLPESRSEVERLFDRYRAERRQQPESNQPPTLTDDAETRSEDRMWDVEDDVGGDDSFFAWFFRGKGPVGLLSGAAFQKNRLGNVSSAYATMFEDDHVAWLLGMSSDVLARLAQASGQDSESLRRDMRQTAYAYFRKRTKRLDGYPRLYVFEAYQFAALRILSATGIPEAERARDILQERYAPVEAEPSSPITVPDGFPHAEQHLGTRTFFTELAKKAELCQRLWPTPQWTSFVEQFREREQRRELLSAMARLGAAYVDLYLLAIRRLGSFELGAEAEDENVAATLIADYLNLLESQMQVARSKPQFNAYYELHSAAGAFETLLAVNFPEARDVRLSQLATIFSRGLQHQQPVGKMFGGVNKRMVKQFRMPGYPLVLATTDVLQEGEDLHTFCRRVIHYGITWTPSAMEQRTGRVDRIGSLAQRHLDGADRPPQPEELIQVYYPHLTGTVEQLQVQTVLKRLNKFLRMIHKTVPGSATQDSTVNVSRAILNVSEAVPRIEVLLESDFPVRDEWLRGEATPDDISRPDLAALEELFIGRCVELKKRIGFDQQVTHRRHRCAGRVAIAEGRLIPWEQRADLSKLRQQPFELELRAQMAGDATLIRCRSPIGLFDLRDDHVVDRLYELQRDLGMVRLCSTLDLKRHRYELSVETDRLFEAATTQIEELEDLVCQNVLAADRIEHTMLNADTDTEAWLQPDSGEESHG